LAEINGVRILFDPGNYSDGQNKIKNIDLMLITHKHQDHFDASSVEAIIKNNSNIDIITNKSVGAVLDEDEIPYRVLKDRESFTFKNIIIKAFDTNHALIYPGYPTDQNTGYLIDNELFYPGDSFIMPDVPVRVVALPIAGPWMKTAEAVEYVKKTKPEICFPVHEWILESPEIVHHIMKNALDPTGISFVVPEICKETDL